MIHIHEAKPKTSDYWRSPVGITRRIEMLSQDFTYKIVNNSLMFYGYSAGITRVRWATNPGASETGPCIICDPLNGNIYRKGQFLPPLPAHSKCVCSWELLFDPKKIPLYVV